jgi:hypothetical protein
VITELSELAVPKQISPLPVRVADVSCAPMLIVTLSVTAGQTPAGSFVVRIRVAVFASLSAALGVYTALSALLFGT